MCLLPLVCLNEGRDKSKAAFYTMADNTKNTLAFGERLTAYEAPEHLESLHMFLQEVAEDRPASVDATAVSNIDTAGCQLLDLAITGARKKKARLEVNLSDPVRQAFHTLGLQLEEEADGTG